MSISKPKRIELNNIDFRVTCDYDECNQVATYRLAFLFNNYWCKVNSCKDHEYRVIDNSNYMKSLGLD